MTGRELMESRWDGDPVAQCGDCKYYTVSIKGEACLSDDGKIEIPCPAFTPILVNLRKCVLEAWGL